MVSLLERLADDAVWRMLANNLREELDVFALVDEAGYPAGATDRAMLVRATSIAGAPLRRLESSPQV